MLAFSLLIRSHFFYEIDTGMEDRGFGGGVLYLG